MTYTTAVLPPFHRAMSANPEPIAGEVEVGVRYDVDCSTENPVSHGVRVADEGTARYGAEAAAVLFYSAWDGDDRTREGAEHCECEISGV